MASVRIASGATAAVLCGLIMMGSAVRAIRIDSMDPAPVASVTASGREADLGGVAAQALPGEAAMRATLDRNPFHPERRRGGVFTLAGANPADSAPEVQPAPRPVSRLFGTALVGGPERNFILCQPEREMAQLVWVGERCGALLLIGVERARARFLDEGGEDVVLEVPKAGMQ